MVSIIKLYFDAWINKDLNSVKSIFADNVIYTECYGPVYCGISQIIKWFEDWNKVGSVLKWDIKRFVQQDRTMVVEWFFQCDYNDKLDEFDGTSIIDFNDELKIIKVSEFQSKSDHYYPYGK